MTTDVFHRESETARQFLDALRQPSWIGCAGNFLVGL